MENDENNDGNEESGPTYEKALEFIDKNKKKNAVKATNRDVRNLSEWLATEKFDIRDVADIPPHQLNELLVQYFVFIQKKDGSEYQPSSLTNKLHSIDRYLKEEKYAIDDRLINIMKDPEFGETRRALASKRMALKKQGLGNRPNRATGIEEHEEDLMWLKGILGKGNSFSIQFTLWYFFTLIMGLRGRDEHRRICFGDITLGINTLGVEYLKMTERNSKTRDGAIKDDNRATRQKIFCSCASQGNERCVIEIYKEFVRRRPGDFCKEEDPFYLQVKSEEQISRTSTPIWFKREPYGIQTLGKLLPKACMMAGIPVRGNHGVRATTVQRLRQAQVPDDKIIQITGHKSCRTLSVYDTEKLETNEHIAMQSILQRQTQKISTNSMSKVNQPSATYIPVRTNDQPEIISNEQPEVRSILPLQVSQTQPAERPQLPNWSNFQLQMTQNPGNLFSGATFNHCTFNINPAVPPFTLDNPAQENE